MKSKFQSVFCWHTMATIYKQKKDFFEASKAFQNACKLDTQNIAMLKETAAILLQTRDLLGHAEKRAAILKLKPNNIQNWASFVTSHHLVIQYLK